MSLVIGVGAGGAGEPAQNPRQTGSAVVRVWTSEDMGMPVDVYRILVHPQTGWIYTGCTTGWVEFDGRSWRGFTRGPNAANSIAVDSLGRLWKGASGDIQCATPDAAGEWEVVTMRDRVPKMSLVYHARTAPDGVYFADLHRCYFFPNDDATPSVWTLGEGTVSINGLWMMDDTPFVSLSSGKVFRLRGREMEPVPGLSSGALAARAAPQGGWQLLTSRGVDHWDGVRRTEGPRPLGTDSALAGIFLRDGRIAFGTQASGVVVCDAAGNFLQRIDRTKGLVGNLVRDLAEDREGGIWLTQTNAVARVQVETPYARHGAAEGLEGASMCVRVHRGLLHVGTTEGLWRREANGHFTKIEGIVPGVRFMLPHGDDLLILGNQLHVLRPGDGKRARTLDERYFQGIQPLETVPGGYVLGSHQGPAWGRWDGEQWSKGGLITPKIPRIAMVVHQGPPGIVWVADHVGLWRFDVRGGPTGDAPSELFTPEHGLTLRGARLFELGGSLVAVTQEGGQGEMLRFDEQARRFVPELRIAGLPKSERFPRAAAAVDRVLPDSDGTYWLQLPEPLRPIYHVVPAGADRWEAARLPGPTLPSWRPNAHWHDAAARTLWIAAGPAGLISRDLSWKPTRDPVPPAAVVRRITLASGQAIYGGATIPSRAPRPILLGPEQDSLRIGYSSPAFFPDERGRSPLKFRTRLEGVDRDWSPWTTELQRDFTSLPWRTLRFRVQARDETGRIGPEGTMEFALRAPWWGTRWAWAGYALVGLGGVAGLVGLRTRTLRRRAAHFEAIVVERTQELAQTNARLAAQNEELARLNRLELDEKIAAQLAEEKARLEVLRYQLNPHFLYNALNSIYGLALSAPRGAAEMTLRLAEFCRHALVPARERVTVGSEFEQLAAYLEVEQARWGETLAVSFTADEVTRAIEIPPFLLLPLVENAIKYGGASQPGRLEVAVRARLAGRSLTLEVANTGTWVPGEPRGGVAARPSDLKSTGIGLANVRQRLARCYPQNHEFTVVAKDGWVVATVTIADTAQTIAPAARSHE
jgi:hypothetical protein